MTNLSLAKTKVLTYAGTTDASIASTVLASGNRVCLRGFGILEYPSTDRTTVTKAIFQDGGGTEVFSCYSPFYSASGAYGEGSPMVFIEIPGEGVLFDDGLIIELEEVTDRHEDMRTVLQVVYI